MSSGCCIDDCCYEECICFLNEICYYILLGSMLLLTLTGLIIGIGFYGNTLSQFNTYNTKFGRILEVLPWLDDKN
jgi:hypothetical protein